MPTVFDPLNPPVLDDEQIMFLYIMYTNMAIGLIINLFYLFVLLYHWRQTFQGTNLILSLNLSSADTAFFILNLYLSYPLILNRSFNKNTNIVVEGFFTYFVSCYVLCALALISIERYTIIVHSKTTTPARLVFYFMISLVVAVIISSLPIYIVENPFLLSDSGMYISAHLGSTTTDECVISILLIMIQGCTLNAILYCYMSIINKVRGEIFKPIQMVTSASMPNRGVIDSSREVDMERSIPSHAASVESGSSTTDRSKANSPSPIPVASRKRNQNVEIQIVRRAMAITLAHLICWTPYMTYCFLIVFRVQNLRTLDYFIAIGIELSSVVNASFSLAMDPKVRKFVSNIFSRSSSNKNT